MKFRILSTLILLFSCLFLPFWASFTMFVCCVLVFESFFEGVILFFLMDLFYGTELNRFFNFVFTSSLVALFVVLTGFFLKKKLKFYK